MKERMFDSPVFIVDGKNIIQEIACLEDALDFLYDWPKHRRGAIYETALRACQRAFDGLYPVASARQAFAGFAKSVRILEDVSTPLPWIAAKTGQGGGVTA